MAAYQPPSTRHQQLAAGRQKNKKVGGSDPTFFVRMVYVCQITTKEVKAKKGPVHFMKTCQNHHSGEKDEITSIC